MNFRDELEHETQHLPVPHTDIDAIVTTARVRSRRRRLSMTTVAATVVITGTVVGIQQLSSVRSPDSIASPPASESPDNPADNPATEEPTTTTSIAASESLSVEQLEVHFDNAVPAQRGPDNITWSVYDADSPEALAQRFDSSQRYALATMPATGYDSPPKLQLFEQVDGKWTEVDFEVPKSLTPTLSGDTIYAIGTAPATAGGTPGSFGAYDIASGTWQLHETPVPVTGYSSPFVNSPVSMSSTPIDGGLLVAVSVSPAYLSPDKVMDVFQYEPRVEGATITGFTDCDEEAIGTAVSTRTGELGEEAFDQILQRHCTEKSVDASELGLSQADIDALNRPGSFTMWKVTSDSMEPLDTAAIQPGVEFAVISHGVLTIQRDIEQELYSIGRDGSVNRIFADVPIGHTVDYGMSAKTVDGTRSVAGVGQYLLSASPGSATEITDVTSAAATADMVNPSLFIDQTAVAGPLTVAAGSLRYEPPTTLTEPLTLTDSGYSLVIADGAFEVIDTATGQPPSFGYDLSTESGKLELRRYSDIPGAMAPFETMPLDEGSASPAASVLEPPMSDSISDPTIVSDTTIVATTAPQTSGATTGTATESGASITTAPFDPQAQSATSIDAGPEPETVATFDIDWTRVPGLNGQSRYLMLTTSDGVNVAVTDVHELLDLTRGQQVVPMGMTSSGDGRVIVNLNVTSVGGSLERSVVLVGTPN